MTKIILAGVSTLAILTAAFTSWYTVDQGERGVILRNGALQGVAEPGLHFKLPFFDSVAYVSVKTGVRRFEKMESYSQDQQPATLQVSVNYHIPADQVSLVYSAFGSESAMLARIIDTRTPQQTKNVFGQFTAVTAIRERARLNAEIAAAIERSIDGPVVVESVQIENIDFSDAYEKSVEQRMLAEVQVQQKQQELAQELIKAQITVTQAQAQADSQLARAKATGEATKIQGEAEAEAIRARGSALKDNPALVSLTAAEKWNGVLPTTMVPAGAIPFLDLPNGH